MGVPASWDAVQAVATAVQAAALVTAGVWGYLKFTSGGRGVFRQRLELTIHASLHDRPGSEDEQILIVVVTVHNLGLFKLKLVGKQLLGVYEVPAAGERQQIVDPAIFEDVAAIGSHETITARAICVRSVAAANAVAYEIEATVSGRPIAAGSHPWSAKAVLAPGRAASEVAVPRP
jgi:hypothetical protein